MNCPDSQIFMVGHSSDTIYQNAIRLIMETPQFSMWKQYCTWYSGKRQLKFMDKTITTLGARDEGAIGQFQGKTMSLVYCDEMTLYPESIIDMIDTRLSLPHSMGIATMNPSHPKHKLKQWIDKAEAGDENYYALHFTLDDNPYVDEVYKQRIRDSLSGVFYKRNYLGLWCLAEGAIFDFFDTKVHVVDKPPACAEYWVAGIDYGAVNPFACVLVGVSTGMRTQRGKQLWVEKEYYWDPKKKNRQKTNAEFAEDVVAFLEPYDVKGIYIDPSAASFKVELRRRGLHVIEADNDVLNGITVLASELNRGSLLICSECKNLIREIEGYVWDSKAAERGYDEPMKRDDHACVTGDTLILMNDGTSKSIKCLNEESDSGLLLNYNLENISLEIDIFVNPIMTKHHCEIYELELEDGKILKATADHKILTQRGFVQLHELTLCDMVYTCNINTTLEKNST